MAEPAPVLREPSPAIVPALSEMAQLADTIGTAGAAARKVTILGTAANESITATALTLARLIARHARVVVVDLSASVADAVVRLGRSGSPWPF